MFKKIWLWITRHEHNFEYEQIVSRFQFVMTDCKQIRPGTFWEPGLRWMDGYWKSIFDYYEVCECGKCNYLRRDIEKCSEKKSEKLSSLATCEGDIRDLQKPCFQPKYRKNVLTPELAVIKLGKILGTQYTLKTKGE